MIPTPEEMQKVFAENELAIMRAKQAEERFPAICQAVRTTHRGNARTAPVAPASFAIPHTKLWRGGAFARSVAFEVHGRA